MCDLSAKNKKARRGTGLRHMPVKQKNVSQRLIQSNTDGVIMQQYADGCQLSSLEKRILAEAELQSQRQRIQMLRTEMDEAIRRMWRAKQVLMEVSHG